LGKQPNLDAFWLGRKEGFRTEGLFPSGITYAHNLLFPLSFVTAFLFAPSPRWQKKTLLWLAWGLMIFALLFSLTRGVWIAYGCVLIVCGLVRGRRALLGAVGGIVLCGLFLLSAGDGVRERASEVFDLQAASNVTRSRIWQANLDMIQDQPLFGWGYGNYKQFRAPYYASYPGADTDAHAHNMYLQIGAESGLVGLCAFLVLIAVVLGKGWQIYAGLTTEPLKSCALGILLSVFGFLIGGLTQHNFGDAEVVIVLWAVLGVLMRMEEWGEG
jgi:putative inorganic carbon (HCO3(-)) transporter